LRLAYKRLASWLERRAKRASIPLALTIPGLADFLGDLSGKILGNLRLAE